MGTELMAADGYDTWGGSWSGSWGTSWWRKQATASLRESTGSRGGYFVPDEFPRQQDKRRQWDTDEEILVTMGGPLS